MQDVAVVSKHVESLLQSVGKVLCVCVCVCLWGGVFVCVCVCVCCPLSCDARPLKLCVIWSRVELFWGIWRGEMGVFIYKVLG